MHPFKYARVEWLFSLYLSVFVVLEFSQLCSSRYISLPLNRRKGNAWRSRRFLSANANTFKDYQTLWREPDDVYYTEINVGRGTSNRQKFSVIVDTGSTTIALPCLGCNNCGSQHNHFDQTKSTSVKTTQKVYSQCYGEGSCNQGLFYEDLMCIGTTCPDSESARVEFGCCTSYSSNFKVQKADGIIGISKGQTLIKKLQEIHSLENYQFALCLGRKDGTFSIGGEDQKRHVDPIAWTPLHYPSGIFYAAQIQTVLIGGQNLEGVNAFPNPIFDSGTSYTFLPTKVFNVIKPAFDAFCSASLGHCLHKVKNPPGTQTIDKRYSLGCYGKLDDAMKDTFPGITFEFVGGATLCIPPRAYFFEYDRISCIGISRDVDQEQFMLGANAMVDHNVVFDLGQNKLGIAVSKCDHESTHMGLASCKGGIAKHLSPSPLSENEAPSTDPPKVTKTLPSVGSPLAVSVFASAFLCFLAPVIRLIWILIDRTLVQRCRSF